MINCFVIIGTLNYVLVVNRAVFRKQGDPIWRHGLCSMEADLTGSLALRPRAVDDLGQQTRLPGLAALIRIKAAGVERPHRRSLGAPRWVAPEGSLTIAMDQIQTETIAIVDDDLSAREGVLRWLQAIGLQVESFASAVAFLSGAPESFARLILDQQMPEMTGLELAQRLRADGIFIPIMLLTGDLSPWVVSRAQRLGIEKVLEKPPRLEELSAFCRT